MIDSRFSQVKWDCDAILIKEEETDIEQSVSPLGKRKTRENEDTAIVDYINDLRVLESGL
jgi:hypothetical protein